MDRGVHVALSHSKAGLMRGVASLTDHDPDAVRHGPPHATRVGRGALWFGLFGAPFFWSVQMITAYAVAAHTCFPQREPLVTSSSPGAWTAAAIIIGVAFIGSVAALGTAIANWRATRAGPGGTDATVLDVAEERTRFMSYSGILLGGLFTGGVVLSGLALVITPVCW
jgi:hypothetical protein